MDDSAFPSGPWTGFYLHPAIDDERHPMDLHLEFRGGAVSGGGDDDVGPFAVRGRFDGGTREIHWTKSYLGRHDVWYRGFGQSGFIWGTWELPGGSTGGFKIWPVGRGPGAEQHARVEEELPVGVAS